LISQTVSHVLTKFELLIASITQAIYWFQL